jgi:response regulator RpfG family c-di-GMP phosphodiesterase
MKEDIAALAGTGVLLVEDDAPTRLMITRHLRGSGFVVTAMESAEQVIREAAETLKSFGVVISDVHLPGTSGIDLASYLLSRNPAQPVVLITGDPDEALARDALSRGPVSYLLKPFELFELDAAVRQAIVRMQPMAEPRVGRPPAEQASVSGIPDEWLLFIDEGSYAGAGHADRVARIVMILAKCLPDVALESTGAELSLAARLHELGRLSGPTASPAQMAVQGAELLLEAGFPKSVVRAVRHLHERWDGTGGPDGLGGAHIPATSLALSAADSLDHYCSAWLYAGMKPADAVDRAVSLVVVQQGTQFSPLVAGAVHREKAAIRAVLTAERSPQNEAVPGASGNEPVRALRLA